MLFIDNTVSPSTGINYSRTSKFDIPRSGKNRITFLVVMLFL
jgi:hypothetical protein